MKRIASMLAASLAIAAWVPAVFADTETTTTTTVETTSAAPSFALQSGITYVAVDPTSGMIVGPYDATARFIAVHSLPDII